MNLAKISQVSMPDELEGNDVSLDDSNDLFLKEGPEEELPMIVIDDEPEPSGEILLEVSDGEDLDLTLDAVPGGLDQSEIVDQNALSVDEPEDVVVDSNPWSWKVPTFLKWLNGMMKNVPSHSGVDTVGIERAISYLQKIDKEISKAVRMDINGEIDIAAVERARDEINRGIQRLQERHSLIQKTKYPKVKKNKRAEEEDDDSLVKEAQKATHVGGIVVTAPLFISYLARVLINGMVSAGHDIEDMYKKLDGQYKFTDRERAELLQLMADMGYPVRRDRGTFTDSDDQFDWASNYHA